MIERLMINVVNTKMVFKFSHCFIYNLKMHIVKINGPKINCIRLKNSNKIMLLTIRVFAVLSHQWQIRGDHCICTISNKLETFFLIGGVLKCNSLCLIKMKWNEMKWRLFFGGGGTVLSCALVLLDLKQFIQEHCPQKFHESKGTCSLLSTCCQIPYKYLFVMLSTFYSVANHNCSVVNKIYDSLFYDSILSYKSSFYLVPRAIINSVVFPHTTVTGNRVRHFQRPPLVLEHFIYMSTLSLVMFFVIFLYVFLQILNLRGIVNSI